MSKYLNVWGRDTLHAFHLDRCLNYCGWVDWECRLVGVPGTHQDEQKLPGLILRVKASSTYVSKGQGNGRTVSRS